MTAFKIECPHCSQRIEYDERYCGIQIKCPGCQGDMMIPHLPSASAPVVAPAPEIVVPPPHALRLAPAPVATPMPAPAPAPSIRVVSSPSSRPAAAPPPASRPVPTPRPMPTVAADDEEGPGMSKGKKIALIAALVVIVPVAGYFGFSALSGMQSKFNEDRAKDDDPGLIGGQMGHIAELNSVLDATDPAKMGRFADTGPVVAGPVWTLDVAAAKVPQGEVRGMISGDFFAEDSTMLTVGNGGILLSFVEGPPPPYERSLSFTTPLKPGETLEGRTWTVTKDDPAGAATVTKQWMPRTGGDRQQKSYKTGFALKVELGKASDGQIPGKIFVSLPDPEKTVVAGNFVASIRALGTPRTSGQARPSRPSTE